MTNEMLPLGQVDLEQPANGHEPESDEQLGTVLKRLQDLKREDGSVVRLSQQELGVLQSILKTTTEKYREETIFRMMSFLDEDEAQDNVAAYYEAKDLGMDTTFNVAWMFALVSVNRKSPQTNLTANLLRVMNPFASNQSTMNNKGKNNATNPRSPLA